MNKELLKVKGLDNPVQNCIYMDYLASTPVDPRVVEVMKDCMLNIYGNPNSNHAYGDQAETAINKARIHITELINCSKGEIIFTSGATESINLGIRGFITSLRPSSKPHRIALLPIEHSAVIETCKALEREKLAELEYLIIDNKGRVDLNNIEEICKKRPSLLCVMAAQNEIGNIYPVKEIGRIAQIYGVPFFCDGAQAVGKIPIDFEEMGLTFLTISGHKMYGPKGVGALIIKGGTKIKPLFYGGGQQKEIRPGTLNTLGIVGLGKVCSIQKLEMVEEELFIAHKRDAFERQIMLFSEGIVINGDVMNRLSGVTNLSIPFISNDILMSNVRNYIAISIGSACSAGVEQESHVISALGLRDNIIRSTLRFSIGRFNSDQEIEEAAILLISKIKEIRKQNVIHCPVK
jgi:cysteine desulfurase